VGHRVMADGAREVAALFACGRGALVSHLSAANFHHCSPTSQPPSGRHRRRRTADSEETRNQDSSRPGHGPARRTHPRPHPGHHPRPDPPRPRRRRIGVRARAGACRGPGAPARAPPRSPRSARAQPRSRRYPGAARNPRSPRRAGADALGSREAPAPPRSVGRASPAAGQHRRREPGGRRLWRDQRLVVEVDGFRFHSSRASFERDRKRDAVLAASGYTVLRVTSRQLVNEPEAVVARIAGALAVRGSAG
jgi:hypothetical protein